MARGRTLRNLIVVVVVAIAVGGGGYFWQQQAAARRAVAVVSRQETVQPGTILSTVNATGFLAAQEQVNLYFSSAAGLPVVEINVALGDDVRTGDVLARLDDAELRLAVTEAGQALEAARLQLALLQAPPRPEDIAVAEANLRVARNQVYAASLGQPPEAVEIARLNLVLAQNTLNQTYAAMDRLVEQGRWAEKNALQAQADAQVEAAQIADLRFHQAQEQPGYGQSAAAQAAVEQAEAALERLRAGPGQEDLEIARLQISQAEAGLEIARHDLERAAIVAPFDGVVAAVNLRLGEPATDALPAVVLSDVSRFYLEVLVDEVDVASVRPGHPVTVTLDALPDLALRAQVDKIAPAAQINAGVVSYPVRLSLDTLEAALRGGMTATAAIVVGEVRDVLLVPNWAVRRDRDTGQAFVGLLRDGLIEEAPVTLGLRDEEYSEVVEGIRAGDIVAVSDQREQFSFFGQ
ncbi:MAG: efflux RND transporter periplasmic adaptor subunit [Anaerolineales bacterium]|nr:efflux RND transporter periplasmic adaptor subunit [Anaerolineales bacterium]